MHESSIGLMVRFHRPPKESFRWLRGFGLRHCQLTAPPDDYLYGPAGRRNTRRLQDAIEEYGITVTSLFLSFPDQDWGRWRETVGLVPPATRAARLVRACRAADWGRELGIKQLASHVGGIPADPADEHYRSFVSDLRPFLGLLEANGQVLAYETGQESAEVLKRTITDVGADNQRVNFDPANLLIYNTDTPDHFLGELGDRVAHIHVKDAVAPAPGEEMGRETRFGEGATGGIDLLRALHARDYRGPLTIEREIAPGPEQDRDIAATVAALVEFKKTLAKERFSETAI